MGHLKLTYDYVGGILAGFGVALAFHPLIERWMAPKFPVLSIAGVILASCGGFLALYAQRRAARTAAPHV